MTVTLESQTPSSKPNESAAPGLALINPYSEWALAEPDNKPAICKPESWDHIDNLPFDLTGYVKLGNPFMRLGTGLRSAVLPGELSFNGAVHNVAIKRYYTNYISLTKENYHKAAAREIKLSRWLRHPNVLHFYGICVEEDALRPHKSYVSIVSSLCDGSDVFHYLSKNPTTLRMPLLLDIARGLSYLHEHDIVHGQLKPTNILIKVTDDGIRAVLCGFGCSRVIGDDMALGWENGSYRYTPHEIAKSKSPAFVTKASDVYAYGLTALAVISDKEAFTTPDTAHPIFPAERLWNGERPSRDEHSAPEMSDAIWQIIEACWQQQPSDRPEIGNVQARICSML